jgi:hypothetical protein
MPEELIGPINQVHFHGSTLSVDDNLAEASRTINAQLIACTFAIDRCFSARIMLNERYVLLSPVENFER